MRVAAHDLSEGLRDVSLTDLLGAVGLAALLLLPAAVAEWGEREEEIQTERALQADRRRHDAASAVCAELRGSNYFPVWLANGSMECAASRTER